VQRRVPAARLILQLDEPSLPAVLAGAIPTPSGYGSVPAVEAAVVEDRLRAVLSVVEPGLRVVHCCAAAVPVALLRAAGADAVSLDLATLSTADNDALGEAIDAGTAIWAGVVPAADAAIMLKDARERVLRWWGQLGFGPAQAAADLVPTPACGLAGASAGYARRAMRVVRDVGRSLLDLA
jgi:hypothetical protein